MKRRRNCVADTRVARSRPITEPHGIAAHHSAPDPFGTDAATKAPRRPAQRNSHQPHRAAQDYRKPRTAATLAGQVFSPPGATATKPLRRYRRRRRKRCAGSDKKIITCVGSKNERRNTTLVLAYPLTHSAAAAQRCD